MGGSLARALKRACQYPTVIHGISHQPTELHEPLALGILDSGSGDGDPLPEAQDLVVFATPLQAALSLMARYAPQLRETEPVITDMVSLKAPMVDRARALGLESLYVGSHPMVGGTGSGFGHSREDLFTDAPVWVVHGEGRDSALAMVEGLWLALGARPARIQAGEHDDLMGWVSHLPQLTANALALALEENGLDPHHLGSGGLDMTRLAGSSPEMWVDLLRDAPPSLLPALETLERELRRLRGLLEDGRIEEIEALMTRTRRWRERP
jgi:prephenate dehydrogenase